MDIHEMQNMLTLALEEQYEDAVIETLVEDFKSQCLDELIGELETLACFNNKTKNERNNAAEQIFQRAFDENCDRDDMFVRIYNRMWEEMEFFLGVLNAGGFY